MEALNHLLAAAVIHRGVAPKPVAARQHTAARKEGRG